MTCVMLFGFMVSVSRLTRVAMEDMLLSGCISIQIDVSVKLALLGQEY